MMILSGAALGLSQIYWHRKALLILGAGIETHLVVSVTVVTMLGAGALLATKSHLPLRAFRLAEGAIAAVGAICLWLSPQITHPLAALVPLALASLLAGTSVPLLTTSTNSSFLKAYGPHTLGTASAFFSFPFLILQLGFNTTLLLSIGLNLLTLVLSWRIPRSLGSVPSSDAQRPPPLRLPLVASFLWGTLAMGGQAIILHHLAVATSGASVLFYLSFGCYILGLGIATYLRRAPINAALFLATAALTNFGPLLSWLVLPQSIALILIYVTVASIGLGLPFALLLGRSAQAQERPVYIANFFGSALGVFLFAYLAPGSVPILWIEFGCGLVTGTLLILRPGHKLRTLAGLVGLVTMALVSGDHKYERLQTKKYESTPFRFVKEGRYSTIAIDEHDRIYSNGAFVGAFNINPDNLHNRIFRSYVIQSFLQRPSRVLMIGLGSGSWAASLAQNDLVEHLTVLELDAAFGEIARRDATNTRLLNQKKVRIVFRDARQWLKDNATVYDLIIFNTTFHWQLNVSHLLSLEFLRLVKSRLRPDGLYAFNATESPHAVATVDHGFKHFSRIANFLIASDHPLILDQGRLREELLRGQTKLSPQLEHLMNLSLQDSAKLNGFESGPAVLRRTPKLGPITDDLAQTEFYRPQMIFSEVFLVGGY